jgi:hypothetical protein
MTGAPRAPGACFPPVRRLVDQEGGEGVGEGEAGGVRHRGSRGAAAVEAALADAKLAA